MSREVSVALRESSSLFVSPAQLQGRPLWLDFDREGRRKVKKSGKILNSIENEMDLASDHEEVEQKKRKKKKLPEASEPWPWWEEKPLRHEWFWEDDIPFCAVREDGWRHPEKKKTRADVWLPKWLLMRLAFASANPINGNLVAEVHLWKAVQRLEWQSCFELMPFRSKTSLQSSMKSIPIECFSSIELLFGGNLMWHAARKGDNLLCAHIIERGFGALIGVRAYNGLTAFEIALFRGFADTAFLLEPYANIRAAAQKRHLHHLLYNELEYICSSPKAANTA